MPQNVIRINEKQQEVVADYSQSNGHPENKSVINLNPPKPKTSTSKYQKLPPRKGKYNEPYHDGLYRFQDIKLVIPGASGSDRGGDEGTDKNMRFEDQIMLDQKNDSIPNKNLKS